MRRIAALLAAAGGAVQAVDIEVDPAWDGLRRLLERCQATGVENVFLGRFASGDGGQMLRGMGVTRAVAAGEQLFCVPSRCFLSSDSSWYRDRWGKNTRKHWPTCRRRHLFALLAAEEAEKDDSTWWPLLDNLQKAEDFRQYHPAYLPRGPFYDQANVYWQQEEKLFRECYGAYADSTDEEDAVPYDAAFLALVRFQVYGDVDYIGDPDEPNEFTYDPVTSWINAARIHNIDEVVVSTTRGSRLLCYEATVDLSAGQELFYDYGYLDSMLSERDMFRTMGFFLPPTPEMESQPETEDITLSHPCHGLFREEFSDPGPDAHPIVLNFWRFAEAHCRKPRAKTEQARSAAQKSRGRRRSGGGDEL